MEIKPFDKARFKHIAGKGVAEDFNYMPRSNLGMRKWEIKTRYPDGTCKVVVMRDSGFSITGEVIEINEFKTRLQRNEEIYRLYHEHGLSQVFLGKLFNISQPSVSLITSGKSTVKTE